MNAQRWQLSMRQLLLIMIIVAVALVLGLQHRQTLESRRLMEENQRLAEEAAQLQFELELQRIGFGLKVPTEALYHLYMPQGQLDQLRWEAFEKFGVDREFVPLYALHDHTRTNPHLHRFPSDRHDLEFWKSLAGSFWESYALNHADDGANLLVGHLKNSQDFRRRLMDDSETVEEYLKPLLKRMTIAPEPRARYAAMEALLLLDDRSETVRHVLRQSLQRPGELPRGLSPIERARFYSWNPDKARELIEKYQLMEWVE